MSQENDFQKLLSNSKKATEWKQVAKWERDNKDWLEYSLKISLTILRELKRTGKTQSWLATEAGFSKQYLSKVLKGKENLRLETIVKFEKALGVKMIGFPMDNELTNEK